MAPVNPTKKLKTIENMLHALGDLKPKVVLYQQHRKRISACEKCMQSKAYIPNLHVGETGNSRSEED